MPMQISRGMANADPLPAGDGLPKFLLKLPKATNYLVTLIVQFSAVMDAAPDAMDAQVLDPGGAIVGAAQGAGDFREAGERRTALIVWPELTMPGGEHVLALRLRPINNKGEPWTGLGDFIDWRAVYREL